jgi:hypothetical protein
VGNTVAQACRCAYGHLNSPVHICRKFSAVFGHTSAHTSIFRRPAGMLPMEMSVALQASQ